MVVPKKEEAGTMELVTAGASCNIHRPACSCSSTQIKVGGGDLKFRERSLFQVGADYVWDVSLRQLHHGHGCVP